MNCVAVEELALSQLLYLIKAKFETLFRICSEVWLIRTAYPCWIFLASTSALFPQPGGNVHASRLPPLLHRSGSSMWHRQRIKPKPKPHHHAPHASQDSNPTVSVIEAQATVQITPTLVADDSHAHLTKPPPCDYQRRRSPTGADASPQAAR